jgi:hypothetical protein
VCKVGAADAFGIRGWLLLILQSNTEGDSERETKMES